MIKPSVNLLLAAAVLLTVQWLQTAGGGAEPREPLEAARWRMVERFVVGAGIRNPRVIEAMRNTPRHQFVRLSLRNKAYLDMALPIGHQQTISSPFIVAFMTEALDPQPGDRVLEIGTGSGYQAAVLSPLVREVYTIEIVESLGRRAERTLRRLGYRNVHVRIGDGFLGWPEEAPFDKIIVTCSPESVPQPLVQQLKEGGRMVIPVGQRYQQTLYLLRKRDGQLQSEALRPTLFVPMTGAAEESRQAKPDAAHPAVVNGGFEEPVGPSGFVPGWYYQRQLTWQTDAKAPEGSHFVSFRNEDAGRDAHLMQGFAVDGRAVRALRITAYVKHEDVQPGRGPTELPGLVISFYDTERKDLGYVLLGPFRGDSPWRRVERTVRVPRTAREAILRIGLFGATGQIAFDGVAINAVDAAPP